MIASNMRQGDQKPSAASRRRLRNGAALALLCLAVLASALVSDQALAEPLVIQSNPEEATGDTPRTGVPFDKAKYQQTRKATAAYKAGVKAMNEKKLDEALAKFRESYGVVASPNSRHMIARAHFEAGKLLEAYFEAQAAITEAEEASKKAAKYKKTAAAARAELDAIIEKLAVVTVNVVDAPVGAALTVAGIEIPSSNWGQELLLLPGETELVLTTEAGTETKKVTLEAGPTTIDISPPAPKPVEEPVDDTPEDEGGTYEGPDRLMMAIIAGGVGVAGMISFSIFGAMSSSKHDVLQENCNSSAMTCSSEFEEDADAGSTYQVVANVSAVVGAVGLAAGAGLLLWEVMDPPAEEGPDTALRPRVSIGPGAISVSGSF